MKKIFYYFLVLALFNGCFTLKEAHCYEMGKSKIVAYKMTTNSVDMFGKERVYSFYDKETVVFFEYRSIVPPTCVPCDSSFISIIQTTKDKTDSLKDVKTGINIQIGSGNEIKK